MQAGPELASEPHHFRLHWPPPRGRALLGAARSSPICPPSARPGWQTSASRCAQVPRSHGHTYTHSAERWRASVSWSNYFRHKCAPPACHLCGSRDCTKSDDGWLAVAGARQTIKGHPLRLSSCTSGSAHTLRIVKWRSIGLEYASELWCPGAEFSRAGHGEQYRRGSAFGRK